jgi:hypothetical protein
MQLDETLECVYQGVTKTIRVRLTASFEDICGAMCHAFLVSPRNRVVAVSDSKRCYVSTADSILQHLDRGPWHLEVGPLGEGAAGAGAGAGAAAEAPSPSFGSSSSAGLPLAQTQTLRGVQSPC